MSGKNFGSTRNYGKSCECASFAFTGLDCVGEGLVLGGGIHPALNRTPNVVCPIALSCHQFVVVADLVAPSAKAFVRVFVRTLHVI